MSAIVDLYTCLCLHCWGLVAHFKCEQVYKGETQMDRANTIKLWIESMFTDFINPYIASNSRLHSGHLTEFFIFLINENKNIRHLYF